jgi:hypothetical protein
MQQHDFETQIPRARVLTEEELLQAQGGSFIAAVRHAWQPFVDPLPKGLRAIWNQALEAVRAIA